MSDQEKETIEDNQEQKSGNTWERQILMRSFLALFAFIYGFNFSRSAFFEEYRLFGVNYLAEFLISMVAAVVGFFVIPEILIQGRITIEKIISRTVDEIVANFWENQTKRIQDQRKKRKEQQALEKKSKVKEVLHNSLVLDTSVLIDGRIADLVKLNFIDSPIIVPKLVVSELHALSDSKDKLKRQKGRRGLDILKELKKKTKLIMPDIKTRNNDVDKSLVEYARRNKIRLATLDFNLNKVAGVAGVKVVNLNDLANAMKTVMVPGEEVRVKIIHEGKEKKQGVGYLSDGTMIVVEDTKDRVGEEVQARVIKMLQSSAGRMIFCEPV